MPTQRQTAERAESLAAKTHRERDVYNAAQLRAILDTCVEGIVAIDECGVIESFNASAERLFGFRAEEVIGENVGVLMPSPDSASHDEYVKHYLETGEQKTIGIGREVTGRRKDGTLIPLHFSVS